MLTHPGFAAPLTHYQTYAYKDATSLMAFTYNMPNLFHTNHTDCSFKSVIAHAIRTLRNNKTQFRYLRLHEHVTTAHMAKYVANFTLRDAYNSMAISCNFSRMPIIALSPETDGNKTYSVLKTSQVHFQST